ncbi:Ohr family peroxiredoxin [Paraburkholderia azotifigens]|uniref:Ohr family peroxiredoxin n=1 Tax=Paraburkholderia azotifigens TaxID=2057004 RepID=A0A5C6V508_9BURK|nr:Ohr family peroxiredoxin [Paraburkholderia azotifigens]TXC80392.1 Ohr family peroxiredoxin [Paraburkholderia azotifigens]
MTTIDKVLFSGDSHATFNHDLDIQPGEHGVLNLELSAFGGESLDFIGTELHPRAEQLFSGAWSACYISAFEIAASMKKVTLPSDYSVDIHVSIGSVGEGFCLGAQFTVHAPGLAPETVQSLALLAHQICPYSKAVHGNIEVGLNVVTA